MTDRYDVYLTGTFVDGVEPGQAIAAFAHIAGVSQERANRYFADAPQKIRGDLGEEEAAAFMFALRDRGIRCVRRPAGGRLLDGATDVTVQPDDISKVEPVSAVDLPPPNTASSSGPSPTRPSPVKPPPPPPSSAVATSRTPAQRRPLPFVFTGEGFEYFRIWIVNLLLTIVTIGLYGPWAKVRNKQYFYGNTSLDGATFEYTADPVRMLIGRLLALVFMVLYYWAGALSQQAAAFAGVLLMVAMPWAINKSLAFHARNSVYRNLRFHFRGEYPQAFVVFVLWPMGAVLTLGLLAPVAVQRWHRYYIDNHSYGDKGFHFGAGAGSVYRLCLVAFGVALLGIAAGAALGALIPKTGLLGSMAGYALAVIYFSTAMQNLIYNNTTLASHALSADFQLTGYGWVMVSNFVLVVLTLGLYLPWAKVRLADYTAQHVTFHAAGDLDQFAAISQPDANAFGEEFADVFDLDFGF